MLTTRDAQDAHLRIVTQAREELGGDEEVLAGVLATGDLDHALVHHALVAGVHTLVDLVDDAEWRLGHGLESHEVEDGGDGAFAAGLTVGVQLLKSLIFTMIMISVCLVREEVNLKTYRKRTIMSKAQASKFSSL